jgi:hypothetical protein
VLTELDERKGLVKTNWANIRKRVAKVEPTFAKLVDELSPDKSFPIYLAYYPYGAITGDTESPFIPKINGGNYRLSDPNAPKDVRTHLGYGKNSLPFGMILEKELEYFIDLKDERISLPWLTYSPGSFFPFARVLSKMSNRVYAPNGILSTTSGARSVFMLPNIGCLTNHVNLQRDFNVQSPPPKTLYEHWYLFKEIINSNVIECDWRSCIMFFSEKWVNKLHTDKAWLHIKTYMHELAWHYSEYQRNSFYYDIAFSIMQKQRNLKPNPYLADTARHLFNTALGAAPGFAPACNDESLPLDVLQQAFVESYGLKKYHPTILKPTKFNFEEDASPVYYSLQNPATHVFSPKSREASSTLFEMRELSHVTRIFVEELAKTNSICSDTIIGKIASEIEFNYFHNKTDRHRIVRDSAEIPTLDDRFNFINPKYKVSGATFASDAPFVRGCISMSTRS